MTTKDMPVVMSEFASTIMKQKYSHTLKDGTKETWENIAYRTAKHVMKAVGASKEVVNEIQQMIRDRKLVPGGRYLYASGRPFHQTQNCLLLRAEDSREGWAKLMQEITMALMTGAGIGVDYSDVRPEGSLVRKTGGTSTGPIALMQMVNEAGRGIMQGGARRSAIWAGLSWKHADIQKFISCKEWSQEVRDMKEKQFDFPAFLDGTNISVLLDDEFFEAFVDIKHVLHSQAQSVYWQTVEHMLRSAEPGFSVDAGKNSGETLRNACVSGDTKILTRTGYVPIKDVVDTTIEVWNGFEFSTVVPKITGTNQDMVVVHLSNGKFLRCTKYHEFIIQEDYDPTSIRRIRAIDLKEGMKLIKHDYPVLTQGIDVSNAYAQGFRSAEGMDDYNQIYLYDKKMKCVSRLGEFIKNVKLNTEENRISASWTTQMEKKDFVPHNWSLQSKIEWFAGLMDGDGTELKEGGSQISSVNRIFLLETQQMLTTMGITNTKITLMNSSGFKLLPDGKGGSKAYFCQDCYRLLIGAVQMQQLLNMGMVCERMSFNKTPNRDASRFVTVVSVIEDGTENVVYCFNEPLRHMGCFNGIVTGQCTEVTSRDSSDICNLGSINLARITSLEEMKRAVELMIMFLLAGTVYSDVPYATVDAIRTKNRRLGLGLMGIHEWLLMHGKKYAKDDELQKYLEIYATSTEIAHKYAKEWSLSKPVKTRAIAPTGTIGIVAETTTGIEPIFCAAYKRRYKKGTDMTAYQYVLDPTAMKLVAMGVEPDNIEDAYTLAENVENRVAFQAWVQEYVDHAISSTINLPAWGSEHNNTNTVKDFGNMLIKYLPKLRGITCYPDGARGGQPLTPVKYTTAIKHVGEIFIEQADVCDITKAGSCG